MSRVDDSLSETAATMLSSGVDVLLGCEPGEFAESFSSRLEHYGCAVGLAATAQDLLVMARRPYDIIFIDLESPELDALAALRELKGGPVPAACPVVLIKGEGEPEHTIQRGLDLGAAGYILKYRLPAALRMTTVLESFGVGAPDGASRPARSDACVHSAAATFHDCTAFMPINALAHRPHGLDRVTCSHLRSGASEGWQLYPRCAIGDLAARTKYVRDQGC